MRHSAPAALLVAAFLAALLLVVGAQTVAFTDYEVEAEPAATALAAGHFADFAELAPAYGGSLVLRAPFALGAGAVGAGDGLALYRALVLPALLLLVWLGFVVWCRLRHQAPAAAWLALALCVANPLSLRAIETGHPEEIIGAVLAVAAVLAGLRDRAVLAGVLLGLAGANKPWAVLVAIPVLAALDRDRGRCVVVAVTTCSVLLAPLVLAGSAVSSVAAVATTRTEIFQPWHVFWFFGDHGSIVTGQTGVKPGFREASSWAQAISHPLVVLAGLGLCLAWWRVRTRAQVLALLSLVLLTRCLLDTWNTDYYALPFILALLAHEVAGRGRAPWATLVLTLGLWVSFQLVSSPDLQAAVFLIAALPAWAALACAAFAPAVAARCTDVVFATAARHLPNLFAPSGRAVFGLADHSTRENGRIDERAEARLNFFTGSDDEKGGCPGHHPTRTKQASEVSR